MSVVATDQVEAQRAGETCFMMLLVVCLGVANLPTHSADHPLSPMTNQRKTSAPTSHLTQVLIYLPAGIRAPSIRLCTSGPFEWLRTPKTWNSCRRYAQITADFVLRRLNKLPFTIGFWPQATIVGFHLYLKLGEASPTQNSVLFIWI